MLGSARKDATLAKNREFLHYGKLLQGLALIKEED
jgi:hypothetical protein